jgi:hypothetical protein
MLADVINDFELRTTSTSEINEVGWTVLGTYPYSVPKVRLQSLQ